MRIAKLTLDMINDALVIDQGAKYRGILGTLMPHAADAYSTKEDAFRSHLGASLIGRDCVRDIWYSFHWSRKPKFDGRMLRLFNRGHLEEPRMVALLKLIGVEVWQHDAEGNQFRIKGYKGHFGGSMDGVVRGVPDLPSEPMIAEFKTHGDKSFKSLKADGVIKAKPEHYVQMIVYMGKNNLRYALYMAVNKNDDELYAEIIDFVQHDYDRYMQRVINIVDATNAPQRVSNSPGWWKCKFCDFKGICHGQEMPEVNCRTCIHSRTVEDAKWICEKSNKELDEAAQLAACPNYLLNPTIKLK